MSKKYYLMKVLVKLNKYYDYIYKCLIKKYYINILKLI